nr:MAG TPA: hypothetical protein [Caudoviricetes sp.]
MIFAQSFSSYHAAGLLQFFPEQGKVFSRCSQHQN